ncbi:hypothetical protein D478_08068 [Brevibacillus agri BAB-2500]|nr:hypothetical protein D478_08068 [Brevibacillus agri BAB-2500]
MLLRVAFWPSQAMNSDQAKKDSGIPASEPWCRQLMPLVSSLTSTQQPSPGTAPTVPRHEQRPGEKGQRHRGKRAMVQAAHAARTQSD